MKPEIVVWLVRDTCRLSDNPALQRASRLAKSIGATLVPLACLEPRRWASQQFGLPRVGEHWARFRAESLQSLRNDLSGRGCGLWISAEEPVSALVRVRQKYRVCAVVSDAPLGTEERLETERIQAEDFQSEVVYTDELFRFEQLPFDLIDLPATFSKFRKLMEKKPEIFPDPPQSIPELTPSLEQPWSDPSAWLEALQNQMWAETEVRTSGGEDSALEHWHVYLATRALSHYKLTRNALFGPTQSSHLSAWLAHGCISARQVWSDILDYERREGANESTYWLRFELLWREFFRWYSRASDWTLFRRRGPNGKDAGGDHNRQRFAVWSAGNTGCDIVDAAMRELNQTGWISNRARQLVASHLIYESNLDWRLGAAYFESRLVDFNVASNWGNWAYIAGVGPDPRGGRIFNLNDQAGRYDPDQTYRRRWLQ